MLRDPSVVLLRVWGKHACFTRPEFKAERRSYDVMTPTAAQGILEAIHWKPQMAYEVQRIYVGAPIQFMTMTVNEVKRSRSNTPIDISDSGNRVQVTTNILVDVDYVIEARIVADDVTKHLSIFNRRASAGQYFTPPNLGARQFVCKTQLLSPDTVLSPLPVTRELGWMFRRRHWSEGRAEKMTFFNARLVRGVLDVPPEGEMVLAA